MCYSSCALVTVIAIVIPHTKRNSSHYNDTYYVSVAFVFRQVLFVKFLFLKNRSVIILSKAGQFFKHDLLCMYYYIQMTGLVIIFLRNGWISSICILANMWLKIPKYFSYSVEFTGDPGRIIEITTSKWFWIFLKV